MEFCRSFGSRSEVGSVNGGNGGPDDIAGSSTVLGGLTARVLGAEAAIRAQRLAGEDGSAGELTSGDRNWNPSLMGQGARREEI